MSGIKGMKQTMHYERLPHYLQCSECHELGHQRSNCPKRVGLPAKLCGTCYGLEHRRCQPRCPKCHELYAPEPAMTIDEALAYPYQSRWREIA